MYKVIKQQLKFSKYKKLYFLFKELIRYAKDLYNKGLYTSCSQQILKDLDQNFKSFLILCKKKLKCNIPKYLVKDGYFKLCDPEKVKRINNINNELYWTIPLSMEILKKYNWKVKDSNRPKIKIPNVLKNKNIYQ